MERNLGGKWHCLCKHVSLTAGISLVTKIFGKQKRRNGLSEAKTKKLDNNWPSVPLILNRVLRGHFWVNTSRHRLSAKKKGHGTEFRWKMALPLQHM
jgi:hypothetical protein